MSLYNMLFGRNEMAPALLKMLGTDAGSVPRFRDCFLSEGRIVIHTRTGGGNREYYDAPTEENQEGPFNEDLRELPGFLGDEDDDFDCTYANFYFSYPEEFKADLEAIENGRENITPSQKWQALFDSLKGGQP